MHCLTGPVNQFFFEYMFFPCLPGSELASFQGHVLWPGIGNKAGSESETSEQFDLL